MDYQNRLKSSGTARHS